MLKKITLLFCLLLAGTTLGQIEGTIGGIKGGESESFKAGTAYNDTAFITSWKPGDMLFLIDRNGTAGDTIKTLIPYTGMTRGVYYFAIDADDSSVVFIDGSNLRLNANFTLDKTDDRLPLLFEPSDSTWFTIGTPASNE